MIEGDLFGNVDARDKMDLKSVVSDYSRYWYVFLLSIIIFGALAFLRIRYTIPEYHVGSTILIKDQEDGGNLLAGPAMSGLDMFSMQRSIEDEISLLKSKSLMERVLTELSFRNSFFVEGRVQDVEVFESDLPVKLIVSELRPGAAEKKIFIKPQDNNSFILGEMTSDGNWQEAIRKFGQQINKPYAKFTVIETSDSAYFNKDSRIIVVFHDIKSLAARYSNELTITPVNKTSNVIDLSITDPVWKKSVAILNKLLEVYEQEAVEDKNRIASNALAFIDERLRYLTEELSSVEKNVELYKKQNDLTNVSSEAELYLKSADDYNRQLAEYDIQIDLLKSIEDYLQKQGDQVALVPSALNIQDPTLQILISKFNELQLERQRMQRTTQPDNPLMLNINDQLNNLRTNIGENIKNIRNGLIITRENLVANSAKFEYRKKQVPVMERELLEINRQQSVKEGLYLYLLQKREESALSLAASVSNFRIIDAPDVLYPIYPNKPMLYMIAVCAGLILPFSFLYLRKILNDKVMQIREIERVTRTPILGEIARNKTRQFIVVTQDASNPLVEMFRLIRTNLQFAACGKENKVILVTSSMSGEGKSFFSINLAASLVLTGKRVVMLSMDLRKPTLLKIFKLADGPGITNYLIGDNVSVNDIVRPSNMFPNLFIVTSGPVLPSPTELMMGPKIGKLIGTLKASFDHIIIDTAPVGLVADAFALSPYLDSTIYLVRRNYTPKDCLEIVDKIYREQKLKYPMIVLNDTTIGKQHKYGYGYGYTKNGQKPMKTKNSDSKHNVKQNGIASSK